MGKESWDEVHLFLSNAGTAMRPLTAAVTAGGGNSSYVLDGVPRMRERPIGDLVTGLKQLGADVDCFLGTNCPPVRVVGKGGLPGGKALLSEYYNLICNFCRTSVGYLLGAGKCTGTTKGGLVRLVQLGTAWVRRGQKSKF
ncbi:unnamed protein product [Camellia sinensis]